MKRLPVRVRFWDPRDGASRDAFFTYSQEQSAEFFDPAAFKQILPDPAYTTRSMVYAFLTDPGGRPITSRDVKRKKAQTPLGTDHLPAITVHPVEKNI